jgi:hypothetical protein
MNKGMRGRLGDGGRPSEALVESYVLFLDRSLDSRFRAAPSPAACLELACAGAANATDRRLVHQPVQMVPASSSPHGSPLPFTGVLPLQRCLLVVWLLSVHLSPSVPE